MGTSVPSETLDPEILAMRSNYVALAARVRAMEKLLDVWDTPWLRLALFVIDGWPLRRVVYCPQWRPWRRWWTS